MITAFSCGNIKNNEDTRNITLNDTITTSSGLKYIFLKKGTGPKIEVGSIVKAYTNLYINDADTIFWTTASEKDSIFRFVHGKTSLIKGFSELNSYLSEGDEVIAILPDSLAYGKDGRNGMPGGATLIYNPYLVRSVSEPKEVLSDTLYAIITSENSNAATIYYEKVMKSEVKKNYHTDLDNMMDLIAKLNKDSLYSESEYWADYFLQKTEDYDLQKGFKYYKLVALEAQGKIKEAILLVEPIAKQDGSKEWWKTKLIELQEKLDKQ